MLTAVAAFSLPTRLAPAPLVEGTRDVMLLEAFEFSKLQTKNVDAETSHFESRRKGRYRLTYRLLPGGCLVKIKGGWGRAVRT